jgi:hypothetical protein
VCGTRAGARYHSLPIVDAPATGRAGPEWLLTPELDLPPDVEADAASIVAAVEATQPRLDDHQRAMLEFERRWWRQPGAKEQAIRDTFEMSPTRYYQALNAILDLPQAVAYDPQLVYRLQRLRTAVPRSRGRRRLD